MDGFNDLLEEIKSTGGLLVWITQKKTFLENTRNPKRTTDQLKHQVLQSARLKHVIDQIHCRNKANPENATIKRDAIEKEAKKILDEMAHQFDLKYVRLLGYTLMKVFSKIFKSIYYNSDIETNMQVMRSHPVILLPLHRSYMDFLLVSIICFHKNIQLPGVAAGMDFLGLSFLSNFIRNSGGFFIRRSFGSDELYWAVFHEYVQEHLLNCDRPLEFFIEGTRSRTSKSLPPKFGMIASCIELYMKLHRVDDIYFVPISLTYERLLEEILYSNELLGVPKPKESVSSLVKARTILSQNYGSIFINFARPVSLREMLYYIDGPINVQNTIAQHTITPSFVFELNKSQHRSIELVSYTMLLEMLRNQVIQPVSVIATCLLIVRGGRRYATSLHSLCIQIDKLRRTLLNLGSKVFWPKLGDLIDCLYPNKKDRQLAMKAFRDDEFTRAKLIILENLETHSNLFDLEYEAQSDYTQCLNLAKSSTADFKNNHLIIRLKQANIESTANEAAMTEAFNNASNYIAFCSYRNQLVCFLIRPSLLAYSLLASSTESILKSENSNESEKSESPILSDFDLTRALSMFKFLLRLLGKEFIFKPDNEEKDFNDALNYLVHTNVLTKGSNGGYQLVKSSLRQLFFYAKMFEYILENYAEVYNVCLNLSECSKKQVVFKEEKQFTKNIQTAVFNKILGLSGPSKTGNAFDLEVLSFNLLSNSLLTLNQFNVLTRPNRGDYCLNVSGLAVVHRNLRFLLDVTQVKLSELNNRVVSVSQSTGGGASLSLAGEFEFDFSEASVLTDKRNSILNRSVDFDLNSKL